MAIEDVIRDLHNEFKPRELKLSAKVGGHVNPSYFEIGYKDKKSVIEFWAVASGSQKEKDLAMALMADIAYFIQEVDQCQEVEPEKAPAVEPERPRNGRRNKSNVSGAEFKPIQ